VSTTITFTNEYGTYSASVPKDSMACMDVISDLVIPVLLAAQYSRKTIDEALENE
jgi:hypothetical protein